MFYIINTDWNARTDIITCDLWFESKMAFAGDFVGNKWDHAGLFRKLTSGDFLFMYHSKKDNRRHGKKTFVGIGEVFEEWDEKCYEGRTRILYNLSQSDREIYEYRIPVKWHVDWRHSPKEAKGLSLFTTPRMWATIDENKYPVRDIIRDAISKVLL